MKALPESIGVENCHHILEYANIPHEFLLARDLVPLFPVFAALAEPDCTYESDTYDSDNEWTYGDEDDGVDQDLWMEEEFEDGDGDHEEE